MKNEKGSIVVWLLVGVLLLAALSVVMMQGSRTSAVSLSQEESKVHANQLMSFGQEMKATIQRLKMRGCADTQLGFDNGVWTTNAGTALMVPNHNPNATDRCKLFNIAGGGLTPATFKNNGVTPTPGNTKSGHSTIISMSIAGVGTPANDLVMITFYVDKQSCLAINNSMGITNPGGDAAEDDLTGMLGWFDGTYGGTAVIGDNAPEFHGHSAGCFHYLNGGGGLESYDYHFYQVLLAR